MHPLLNKIVPVLLASFAVASAQAGNDGWLTSYSKALKLSAKTGKPVLANFTGSDWCIFCKKLDGEVFSKPEFKKWAAKNVILLKLDYPETTPVAEDIKKQNAELLHKYVVKGFPTIYFLKSSGKAFGMYGYDQGGPVHWTSMADRLVNPNQKTTGTRSMRFSSSPKGYPPYVSKTLYADNDFRGKKAPKLDVEKWLTGKAPETEGKVVLIDFWATWCPSCRDLIPELASWQKKFGKDLVVIGVSDENPKTVQKFMQTTKMPYNVGSDTKQRTEKILGVQSIPQVLVITPDHVVRWQGYPGDKTDQLTESVVASIIATSKKQSSPSHG
jgi:thiol-disulfide isomerase/thioredoxin